MQICNNCYNIYYNEIHVIRVYNISLRAAFDLGAIRKLHIKARVLGSDEYLDLLNIALLTDGRQHHGWFDISNSPE